MKLEVVARSGAEKKEGSNDGSRSERDEKQRAPRRRILQSYGQEHLVFDLCRHQKRSPAASRFEDTESGPGSSPANAMLSRDLFYLILPEGAWAR